MESRVRQVLPLRSKVCCADRLAHSRAPAGLRWVAVTAIALNLWGLACVAAAADLAPWRGGPTPALALSGIDGRISDVSGYRGRVVLVNFWATWCAPCREEMPAMQRLHRKLAGRGFEILAVNLGEPLAAVADFFRETPLEFQVLLDPGRKASKSWGVIAVPTSYVIDTRGRIRYVARGDVTWDDQRVASTFAELTETPTRELAPGNRTGR